MIAASTPAGIKGPGARCCQFIGVRTTGPFRGHPEELAPKAVPGRIAVMAPPPEIAARAPLLQRGVVLEGRPRPDCRDVSTVPIAARAPLLQGCRALVGGPPPARCREGSAARKSRRGRRSYRGCRTPAPALRNPSILLIESTHVDKFYTPFSPPQPTPSPCFSEPFTKSPTARSPRSPLPPPSPPPISVGILYTSGPNLPWRLGHIGLLELLSS